MTKKCSKKLIVIKVGTSCLTHDNGHLNLRAMENLVKVIADLQSMGHKIILVTSGAIVVGRAHMHDGDYDKHGLAAIGQCRIMHIYDKLFSEYNRTVAQVLITYNDANTSARQDNFYNTLKSLIDMDVIPIANENDSVAYHGHGEYNEDLPYGNDVLATFIAITCNADLLILLTDVDGLYTKDPHKDKNAQMIKKVNSITPEIKKIAGSGKGTGGMDAKIYCAKYALDEHIKMIITNGNKPENIYDIVDGKDVGTIFVND